jgi:hypothetical protein
MPHISPVLAVLVCMTTVLLSETNAAQPVLEPTGMWSGKIQDESLRKLAPKSGFIGNAEAWKRVSTAWLSQEELPRIDFEKELVLVGTVSGPNLVMMRPTITQSGEVRFVVGGTKIGGPGFGYKLIKISRSDVKSVNGNSIVPKGVQGELLIPKTIALFEDHRLEIKLWEYDPFLADVSAKLVDEFVLEKYSHRSDKTTKTKFSVGSKLEPREDRRYYITVFILQDGKRTHIGEQDGKSGLCKVLTQGNPSLVKMIFRAVK